MIQLPERAIILQALRTSASFSEFTKKLDLNKGGDTYKKVKALLSEMNIDFSAIDFRKGKARKGKKFPAKTQETVDKWLRGESKGWTGITRKLSTVVREYLLNLAENKCSKCGWSEVNPTTKKIPLEVNHINGNAEDCRKENLEVVCPNCHALTPNFRRLNKASKRIRKLVPDQAA